MAATGVICEFNPFHDGHAYLLSRMRESVGEAGCVVCLMSGRFVQRGEAAMADPCTQSNPRPTSKQDYINLLRACL
jgi:predicted nucleotidyltransferase